MEHITRDIRARKKEGVTFEEYIAFVKSYPDPRDTDREAQIEFVRFMWDRV